MTSSSAKTWLLTGLRGARAGTTATLAMTALMLAAQKAGLMGRLPPRKITKGLLNKLGISRSKPTELALTTGAHLGYGVASGAVFAALLRSSSMQKRPVLAGAAFGGLIWFGSYFGWIPALGLMPAPTRDRGDRSAVMLASHLVFGAVLGGRA